jgi:transposase
LSKLYRQASDPIERTRYQIIWLLATGRVTEDVADVTGYCRNSIYRLVRRYNQLGANGLKDKRHQHDELEEVLFQRCQVLLKQSSLITGITYFHWWPKTKAISFRCNRN